MFIRIIILFTFSCFIPLKGQGQGISEEIVNAKANLIRVEFNLYI